MSSEEPNIAILRRRGRESKRGQLQVSFHQLLELLQSLFPHLKEQFKIFFVSAVDILRSGMLPEASTPKTSAQLVLPRSKPSSTSFCRLQQSNSQDDQVEDLSTPKTRPISELRRVAAGVPVAREVGRSRSESRGAE